MTSIGMKRKSSDDQNIISQDEKVVVAFQGSKGSFTSLAAQNFFNGKLEEIELTPHISLKAIYDSLSRDRATYGVLPLESSSYGTIHGVYDRLVATDGKVEIVGELGQIEQFCLCVSNSNAQELDVCQVLGHPHILECCSDFLDSLDLRRQAAHRSPLERIAVNDSTAACSNVEKSHSADVIAAAIGSKEAADLHKLKVLVSGIGNDKNAETRYIILARKDPTRGLIDPFQVSSQGPPRGSRENGKKSKKTSIALALRNIPGAIFKMSSCFAFRNLDILKIESRPLSVAMQLPSLPNELRAFTQRHWQLIFYLDYEPAKEEEVNEALMSNLGEYAVWIRQLGTYQSGLHPVDNMPSDWSYIADIVAY